MTAILTAFIGLGAGLILGAIGGIAGLLAFAAMHWSRP